MTTYTCPACNREYHSADPKSTVPCPYCGGERHKIQHVLVSAATTEIDDLYSYLQNELDNHNIHANLFELNAKEASRL